MRRTTITDPVTISVTGTTLQARDIAGNTSSFGLVGWDQLEDPHSFDEPIDAVTVGRVSEIRYDLLNMVDIQRVDGTLPQPQSESGSDEDGGDNAVGPTDTPDTESAAERTAGDEDATNPRLSVEAGDQELTLPDGAYICRFDANLFVRLRFDAPVTIKNRSRGPMTISFEHPTRVTFGFKSPVDYPRDEITVAPTPNGVATALSYLSRSIETTTADRVHRNYRGYPPLLAVDDNATETIVPDSIRENTPETGLELVVPPDLSTLFVAAPLAYYLGARVRTTEQVGLESDRAGATAGAGAGVGSGAGTKNMDAGEARDDSSCDSNGNDSNSSDNSDSNDNSASNSTITPYLHAPAIDFHHEFANGPAFATAVRALLQRTFFLDLLVSWIEPTEPTVLESDALTDAGIDLSDCPEQSIAERVQTYLSLPDEPIDEILPQWPYRMTVAPTAAHIDVLPHLLYDLAAIETPAGSCFEVEGDGESGSGSGSECECECECENKVVDKSTGTASDSNTEDSRRIGELRSWDTEDEADTLDDPLAMRRRIHGVLDDGTIADEAGKRADGDPLTPHAPRSQANWSTFIAHPKAYENRLSDLEQQSDERTVIVVFATESIPESAREQIVDTYRRRSDAVSPRVERVDDPTRVELADVFTAGADFLHYIGDCDDDGVGFACTDGTLSPTALPGNEVGLFQLDAANAAGVARRLIEVGSIAGVAGYRTPASERDVSVTTTIGELLLYGQSLATAHTCATVQTDGSGGVVVGDGTHRFVAKWQPSEIQSLQEADDGTIRGLSVPFPVDPVGAHWRGNRPENKRLIPATITHEIAPEGLSEYISNTVRPIYYNGEFYWPEEQKQLLYPMS
ncbi:uncharacterized protein Nmag_3217 [Natrialba magadii ATCC 43099]|nr:uncharacterized protein Nmag_3217 [Natrialba magadii ATCC 43099]